MNPYVKMRKRQEKEAQALPIGFAFNDEQFADMMCKWNLDPEKDRDKIVHIGGGGFIQKKDRELMYGTFKRQKDELDKAIAEDKTGDGFIYQMFRYELANHEYSYTEDPEEGIEACGLLPEEVYADPALAHGLELACNALTKQDCFD